jgi:hypothetical protein
VEGVNIIVILFISIVMADFGVGKDEISIVNSLLAAILTPTGIGNPILVFIEFAVKDLVIAPILIYPSISRSLKLLNPSGKIMKR